MHPVPFLCLFLLACQINPTASDTPEFDRFWAEQPKVDLWIKGGNVIDGTGRKARQADVLLSKDRIVFVGKVEAEKLAGQPVFDATGLTLAPGLIDTHVHGDPAQTPAFENFLAQGVTTICLGQDGGSPGLEELAKIQVQAQMQDQGSVRGDNRTAPNIAWWLGHGTLRKETGVGFSKNPSAAQQQRMERELEKFMKMGIFGLSTGLEYTPGLYATSSELEALAKVVGKHNGLIMSHMRNEDDDALFASIDELLAQGQHCKVHISHLKSVYGQGEQRAQEIIAYLNQAREAGIELTADLYPYAASYTTIGIVFPDWARPPHDYTRVRRERRAELAAYLRQRVNKRNGPEATLFGSGSYAGKTLATVARAQNKAFEEVLIEMGPNGASAAYFVMDVALQKALAQWPWLMFSSDGSPTMRHPRGYGSFARVLGEWTGEDLPLEEAIRKMTALPAQTIGLSQRGKLQEGYFADVIAFDPQKIEARATFANPHQTARGMAAVWVNGVRVWEEEEFKGEFPGRNLRNRKM
jgi:N-acyl-D-amino-acid deacylase